MSGRNLQDYIEVKDRIAEFWKRHPEGRVLTRIVEYGAERVLLFAEVYTDREDARPAATGYAEEVRSDRGVNATSAVENGETSAIGRALANMGMTLSRNRASREEMEKVERHEQQTTPRAGTTPDREPAPRRSAPPTDRPAAVPSAAGPPSPGKATAEELEELSAADFGWTEFWSWARQRGYSDRTSLDAAVGRSTQGMTPVEIRAALRNVVVPA